MSPGQESNVILTTDGPAALTCTELDVYDLELLLSVSPVGYMTGTLTGTGTGTGTGPAGNA